MAIACPICKSNCPQHASIGDGDKLDCPRCGEYSITGSATAVLKNKNLSEQQIANSSGWVRDHQQTIINSDDVEKLLTIVAPSVADRATRLLIGLNKKFKGLGENFNIRSDDAKEWLGISYCIDANELSYLFNIYLVQEMGSLYSPDFVPGYALYAGRITPKGYAYLDSLKHSSNTSQIGFCAMWFDNELIPVWTGAISQAIREAGYDPKRIDGHHHNNKIDDEIIAMIRRSKFVVADFTGQRGGVYFEAGFALGLGLPVIWTCQKSHLQEVHFDNRQYNFVLWEKDKLPEFKQALHSRIEATLGHGTFI